MYAQIHVATSETESTENLRAYTVSRASQNGATEQTKRSE